MAIKPVRYSYLYYLRDKEWANADVIVVSFPKAGRTWLRVLIGKVLSEKYNKEFTVELEELADATVPSVWMTHDRANALRKPLETDKRKYRGKRVIFIARDPRDTVVSYYFQRSRRRKGRDGKPLVTMNISSFIRDEWHGIDRIIDFMNIWLRNQHVPQEFLLIRYEDLHHHPNQELRKVMEFIGVTNLEEELISKAIAFGSFDNMKQLEREGRVDSFRLKAKDPNDPESYKVRRGKVKGYVDYLSKEDIEYVDVEVRNRLDKRFGYK